MTCAQFLIFEYMSNRKLDCDVFPNYCVYKTPVDGPDSRGRKISAIYCLSDSKKNLGAFGTTHGN